MARPAISVQDADLNGYSDRWSPEERAAREAREKATVTPDQDQEIARLDALIADAMKACERGQKVRGKRNPAFANLQALVRTRKLILDTKRTPQLPKPNATDGLNAFLEERTKRDDFNQFIRDRDRESN